jgi:isocitrate dehydrogenase
MMAGGGMYETGAGGTAPKLLQMFLEDAHMRWDSLGEYLALAMSLEDLGAKTRNARASALGAALSTAIGRVLSEKRSPAPAPGGSAEDVDNRGTSFYLALYWAQAAAAAGDASMAPLAAALEGAKGKVLAELRANRAGAGGAAKVDLGGYWLLDEAKANNVMRPSATFNAIIDKA